MPDEYDDIIAAATAPTGPVRTRKGALKFQPEDTDWSLDRLPELQQYFQSTYGRALPLTVKGQGTIHNKLGYDHRASADISLNPTTEEGQALIAELQRRNVPFLAFDRAIPGASTGPHIHVGRPSSRTAAKFNVGAQVKRAAKRVESYDDVIAAAVGQQQAAAPKPSGPSWRDPTFGKGALPADAVKAGVEKFEGRQKVRKAIEAGVADFEALPAGPPTIDFGNSMPADLLERTKKEVRIERGIKTAIGVPRTYNPIAAISDYFTGKTEEMVVEEEARARIDAGFVQSERTREIVDQFTESDKQELAAAIQSMRGEGPVRRGLSTGAQRVTSGLLYKLAGLSELMGGPGDKTFRNPIADYLRRKAAAGELSIAEIEAEAPPEMRQQIADFLTHAVGALPEIIGATAAAGPVGGFAALGGLEATGRKQSFGEIAKETVKGGTIGAVFKAAPGFEQGATGLAGRVADTARSGAAIGVGTAAVEKVFGASDYDAARAAASNVFFHVGMKVPGEIGRFAQAAERALKTPEGERATVGPELQERLSRAETTPAAMNPPAASPIDNAVTGSAVVVPPRTSAGAWRVQTPLPDGTISTKSFPTEVEARDFARKTPEPMELPSAEEVLPPSAPLAPPRRVSELAQAEKLSLAEAIERSQVPFEGPPAFGEGIAPRRAQVQPSGDKDLDAAREVGLDYGIEVVETRSGFTVQKANGEHIADVVTSRQAEAVVRNAILAEPLPTIPPAELKTPQPTTAAETVAGQVPKLPATPALPEPVIRQTGKRKFTVEQETASGKVVHEVKSRGEAEELVQRLSQQERRGPERIKDADWLELTPAERARVRQEVDAEQAAVDQPAPEPIAPRRPLSELMKERAEAGPAKTKAQAKSEHDLQEADAWATTQLAKLSKAEAERVEAGPTKSVEPGTERSERLDSLRAQIDNARSKEELTQVVSALKSVQEKLDTQRQAEKDFDKRQELHEQWRETSDLIIRAHTAHTNLSFEGIRDATDRIKKVVNEMATRRADKAKPVRQVAPKQLGPGEPAEPTGPINLLTGKPVKGKQGTEGGYIRVDEIAKAIRKVKDEASTKKGGRVVEYVLTQPTGRELFISMEIDRRGVARPFIGPAEKGPKGEYNADVTGVNPMHFGVDGILALKRYLMQIHPEITRVRFERAGSTSDKFQMGRKVGPRGQGLKPVPRTRPELPPGPTPGRPVEIAETRQLLARRGLEFREVEGAPIPTFTVHNAQGREVAKFASARRDRALEALDNYAKRTEGEGGFIDLNEIREGLKAGRTHLDQAIREARRRFPTAPDDRIKAILNRERDPLIGIVDESGALAMDNPYRAFTHSIAFRESLKQSPNALHWRYEPVNKALYWNDTPSNAQRAQVLDYLEKRGLQVDASVGFDRYDSQKLWQTEIEALTPPHHATQQPRTPTGQFDIGAPGGPEAARSQLRAEAIKYRTDFGALDRHQARREGLDIVNDDVAHNYFGKLRRMVDEFLPAQSANVDRAESLYNQGKYGQATMLAETIFKSLPDKVNEYAGAEAAIQLTERGLTPKANWSKVLQEVRDRLQRTGGLSGGGSTFYDVNKRPEGGRPDHEKIAYILEPVVEALKADARRLIAEGKLRAEQYTDHVRRSVTEMLKREEFGDWHPLNKSAAFGVLVDRLRSEGPPPAGGTPAAEPPQQRQRSLPKTLEKSGRDPGTNTTYDRLPNRSVNEKVERRLAEEGAEALESWYRSAPESAERTAAHRVLVDHYTAESVRLYDTAPQRAEALYQRGRDLSNVEAERATTLGQTIQMYSNLLKYTPAGVTAEMAKAERAGAKVPVEVRQQLLKGAQEHQRLDGEVRRLERELVEAEGAESGGGGPQGAEAGPARPRRYRPRNDTVIDSNAERIRRKLDEAAKRRRAQKAFIATQLRALEQQQTAAGYWKRAMNITRGLMVSSFATAMRNLQTQAIRFDIERLVDATEHTLRRSVGLDSDLSYRNIARNTVRQFRPGQTKEAQELLRGHDAEFWRMFNTYAGGVEVPIPHKARTNIERVFQTAERGVEVANFFNRIQEHHVRSAEFLAELDLHLRKEKGQTLEQFVNRNGIDAIPLDLVRKGVDKALEVTFSDMPLRDGAGGRFLTSMIEVGNYIPPTLSPVAFPRFMFNNLKFLYQHSPAGMIDLARKNQNKPRVVARALVGTSLLLLAYQFRQSDHAGEKWYELKLGDTTLDARPFGPFSTYLFMAESIRRQLNGEKAFTTEEIAGAIGASTGPSGTAIAVAEKLYDYAANGKWDKWQRVVKQEAGEWGRALLTPVRQVKDLIAAFDASQAITRDSSDEPFLGEIKESIPYADTDLPPAHKPTSAAPLRQERPATKAITGWRVITPKSFLERQLDELNFKSSEILSSTGNREADAVLKRVMGPLADELSAELERDPEFKRMSKAARGALLRDELKRIRSEARDLAEEENPELFEKVKEERKPERQRKFDEELNSPGLSRATQLGVPMPIPPRRPGEDDIAYRARLLQLGRARRARLDAVVSSLPASRAGQRSRLHEAMFSG